MPDPSKQSQLEEPLSRLRADREALPWPERRALVASLSEVLSKGVKADAAIALMNLLVDDPKPEVRKEVADLIILLPEDDFTRLAAHLSHDTSSFVQKAVARALDRRRKGQRETQRRRIGLDHVESQYASIEKFHGSLAAKRARKLADQQFDILVGSTIHDIRGILNPLKTGFSTLLDNLKDGRLDPKAFHESLTKMSERLTFLERFVDDMRAYSQATPAERRRERVADVVKEARSVVLDDLKSRGYDTASVALEVDVPENVTAEVARHQIVAAVAHVLKNAYEAMAKGWAGEKRVGIRARVNGEDAEIVIGDTGPGINGDDLAAIRNFIPGQTTKKNQGTGFGLPTAYKYAVAHGGNLSIESAEGKGVTVTITLPLEREEDDEAASACH